MQIYLQIPFSTYKDWMQAFLWKDWYFRTWKHLFSLSVQNSCGNVSACYLWVNICEGKHKAERKACIFQHTFLQPYEVMSLNMFLSVGGKMNACMCPIIANCCLIGSCGRADIRSFFSGSQRNLRLKPGQMGAHCLHPLVAGCYSTVGLLCVRMFALKGCLFICALIWRTCLFRWEHNTVCLCGEATQHQLNILTKIGETAYTYTPLLQPKATLFIRLKEWVLTHLKIQEQSVVLKCFGQVFLCCKWRISLTLRFIHVYLHKDMRENNPNFSISLYKFYFPHLFQCLSINKLFLLA